MLPYHLLCGITHTHAHPHTTFLENRDINIISCEIHDNDHRCEIKGTLSSR